MKVDLTVTISVILGCAAIVSPILTALINNFHESRMRKKDREHEKYMETVVYKRRLIETYLQKVLKCIQNATPENEAEYAECFGSTVSYLPDDIREKMVLIDSMIHRTELDEAYDQFIQLLPRLISILQKL